MSFQEAMMKLANSEFRDIQGFRAKRVGKAIKDGFFKMREEYTKEIQNAFAQKGEDGQVLPPTSGKSLELKLPFQAIEGKEDEVKALLDGFGKRVLEVKEKKLKAETLFTVNSWTPRELEALEHVYEEPAEE
jgi:hypothetical protein